MSDNSSASDSENVVLTSANTLSIASCNAATQTPEMGRHATTTQTSVTTELSPSKKSSSGNFNDADFRGPKGSSIMVLRVDNGFTEDFEKEVKALAIPDVIVEYIKDSCALTEGASHLQQPECGTVNLGFELQEALSKSASSTNLALQDQDGASLNSQELRKCYSMPRNVSQNRLHEDSIQMRSQQCTPKLQRLKPVDNSDLGTSSSTLSVNGHSFVTPPSPNFGYRPLESETSAVYTIIKTCLDTNTVKEIHLLNTMPGSKTATPGIKRKFEFAASTPPEIEQKQKWLQCSTDACSTLFFLPGFFITIFTPVIIVPMILLPSTYFVLLGLLFFATGALGVLILTFSGILGNLVWYYDEKSQKMRLRFHCGRGPRLWFWGNGFYAWSDEKFAAKKEKEFIV